MNKGKGVLLLKHSLYGVIWVILAAVVALIIKGNSTRVYSDILFVEGIVLIIIGFLSSMGEAPKGSENLLGQGVNSFYTNYVNLEVSRKEKLGDNIKKGLAFCVSGVTFILGGIITMFIGYII